MQQLVGLSGVLQRLARGLASASLCSSSSSGSSGCATTALRAPAAAAWGRRTLASDAGSGISSVGPGSAADLGAHEAEPSSGVAGGAAAPGSGGGAAPAGDRAAANGLSAGDAPAGVAAALAAAADEQEARMDRLMRVLLHPISRARHWTGQLNEALVDVNGALYARPDAVLTSTLRALHVVRGVLKEGGHVYVVETHPLLRPLLREAARSCLNPNMWWMETTWSRGMITNAASHRRLFLGAHQPNRRLFAAKGVRLVNPHCPAPPDPPPRLDWRDKWALYSRSGRPGYRALLEALIAREDAVHTLKPPRMLAGRGRDLRLLVVLDTTRNGIALAEAAQRGVPTVALASGQADMSGVTYPVYARDYSPAFVHFFLDMLLRVANVDASALPTPRSAAAGAEGGGGGGGVAVEAGRAAA